MANARALARRLVDAVALPVVRRALAADTARRAAMPQLHPPIFIVGAPRTGSTILYQALTDYFDVLYIDNLACRWYGSLPFGIRLSRWRYGSAPHGNFRSEFGNTARFGGHSPSECGAFWYRWLPRDRHFIDDHEVTGAMVDEIGAEIRAVSHRYGLPLLFKNLNAGQRLRLLSRAVPDARVIYVRRNPEDTEKSILAARRRVGVRAGEWWSIMPPNHERLLALPEPEMVRCQVRAIEAQIEQDLERFPAANRREVHFDDLSATIIADLGDWLGLRRRAGGSLPAFRVAGHARAEAR